MGIAKDNVVLRVSLSGRDVELKQRSSRKSKGAFVNTFELGNTKVSFRETQTNYQKHCRGYEDPPSEGSCFIGTLSASAGTRKQTYTIVSVCGC
jgi:hypothetical protein